MQDEAEFFMNNETREIHHLNFSTPQCRVEQITRASLYVTLSDARQVDGADLCAHCFKSSK